MSVDEISHRPTLDPDTTVLVAGDDPRCVRRYRLMLDDLHPVRVVEAGVEAVGRVPDDVDIVVMESTATAPARDDALLTIHERTAECMLALIAPVDPDVDDAEAFWDAHVVAPVGEKELRSTVATLEVRLRYRRSIRELLEITSDLVALEARSDGADPALDEGYRALSERKRLLEAANRRRIGALTETGDAEVVFCDVLGRG